MIMPDCQVIEEDIFNENALNHHITTLLLNQIQDDHPRDDELRESERLDLGPRSCHSKDSSYN
jgi:hypothetical protein